MLKAIIFDLDGVLADACEIHRQALNQALQEVVGYRIPEDELPKFEGLPTKNKLLILSNMGLVAHDSHAAIATRKQEITHDLLKREILYSVPRVHMMKRLEDHDIQVAIVTNCTKKSAWIMMKNLGIQRYIRMIVTNEDVENPKPDPEGLNLAMRVMGVKPEEVIYVGDQPVDAKAANAAGIKNYIHVNSVNKVCWELFRCRVSR